MTNTENKSKPRLELSSQDQETVLQWLADKWTGERKCQICGHLEWAINDVMVASSILSPTGEIHFGKMVAWIVVYCRHCKYSLLFNAALMGIRTAPPPPAHADDSLPAGGGS